MRLNVFEEKDFPTLAYDDIEVPALGELTSALSGLVGSGVLTPDDKLEEYVREQANLPAVDSMTARMEPEQEAVEMAEEAADIYGEQQNENA